MAEGYEGYQGYGGYGAAMDPATMRARLAMAMLQQGSDASPIRSPWQGAARMSQALFGALMLRQMQDQYGSSWNDVRGAMPTGFGGVAAPGGFSGGEGTPGLPAQPGALADLANDPDIARGVSNAATNNLPDTATIGASMARGAYPPQMGPPLPAMAPNNSAGGYRPGGPMPGGAISPMTPAGSMEASLAGRNAFLHNSVAGPGVPSTITPPEAPVAAAPAAFNPADLAMFQQDMQAVPGTPGGGGAPAAHGEVAQYIAQKAASMGIDPNVALRVAGSEGLNAFNPNAPDRGGDGGSSFGPFQLHVGGINPTMPKPGLGDAFRQATGLNPQDPSTWRQQVDFALSQARQSGWGPWMGAAAHGITGFTGIGQAPAGAAPSAMAFGGAPGAAPSGPALGAIQNAAMPPGGLQGSPGAIPASMQPNMMVAGPGVPSGARGGAPPPMPPTPPDVGGGNSGGWLGNMFGLANPSGPQGGSSPAPAGGAAPGPMGAVNDPRAQKLWEVLANPYAAPGAKQVAMQFLQYYMPHPMTWETMPGTFNQAQKDWMGNFTGKVIPGPHDIQPIDFGTDFNGQAIKGYIDRNTNQAYILKDGQLVPVSSGQSGQQPVAGGVPPPSVTGTSVTPGAPNSIPPGNIPPPNAAWTPGVSSSPGVAGTVPSPAEWTKGLDARQALIMQNPGQFSGTLGKVPQSQLPDVMSEARAIVEGRQQPYAVSGVGPTKPYEQAVKDAVRAIDPAYTSTRYDSVKDFNGSTQGSTGGQLTQGRTGIGHLRQAMELSQQLNQNQSGIGNMPVIGPIYNEMVGNQKQKDIAGAYTEAVTKANSELTRFYLGAPGSAGEREEGLRNELSANANPDVRTKALKELAELANSKIEKLQERWHAGTGGNMPDYPILQAADLDNFKYTQSFGRLADRSGGQGQPPNASAAGSQPGAPRQYTHQGGASGPVVINGEEDYNQLPSGVKFIGPDGKTRTKP